MKDIRMQIRMDESTVAELNNLILDKGYRSKSDAIRNVIHEKATTIDAVEVVRCKDCYYFYKTYNEPYCALWSRFDTELPKETDFCSWAERKTDN